MKSAQKRPGDRGFACAGMLRPDALVVSMQNGVRTAEVLRAGLPDAIVLGGITVGFSVVSKGDGTYRRATSGPLVIEKRADPRLDDLAAQLAAAGFEMEASSQTSARSSGRS